jgi:hypothetical protein
VPLKLNIAGFVRYKLHRYALSNLNIQEDLATAEDLTDMLATGRIYREGNPYGFDRSVLQAPPPMYMRGYFQSFRYIEPIADVIRSADICRGPAPIRWPSPPGSAFLCWWPPTRPSPETIWYATWRTRAWRPGRW